MCNIHAGSMRKFGYITTKWFPYVIQSICHFTNFNLSINSMAKTFNDSSKGSLSLAHISHTQMLLCLHQCVIIRRAKRLIEFIWLSIGSNARVRYGKFNWNKCGIESTNKLTLRTEMKEDRNSEARCRKRVARWLTEEYGIIRLCMLMSHYPTTTKSEIDVMS